MNPPQVLAPLIQRLELLTQVIEESPYISREERVGISKEIKQLSEQIMEGAISFPQGERVLTDLNKRAATDEIATLTIKIQNLNPSSPRIENLRQLKKKLQEGEISPEQARNNLQKMMQG